MDRVYIMSQYRAATKKGQEFNRKVPRYFAKQVTYEGIVAMSCQQIKEAMKVVV